MKREQMSLTPGTRLGPYAVVSPLGQGGMGEVYRARDSKLDRDVALKLLPESVVGDRDRLMRFEREAKTLAALNHPNIAHVYDAGADTAGAYLVMELVDGEDLTAQIARGPMPVADVLPIARQLIDALEAAHESGIIHRDLKPANIKVRADGTVKVLDFGLAKAIGLPGFEDPALQSNVANSPTLTARAPFGTGSGGPEHGRGATQMGMILGTAAYMSPEQARGRTVDRRADIWAFGVVLYELLSGRRAFDPSTRSGDSVQDVLAAVLRDDVDWSALPADLPPSWRQLLRRCLEKDPRRRLSAIADARFELEATTGAGTDAAAEGAHAAADRARFVRGQRVAWMVAAAAGVVAVAALAALWWSRQAAQKPPRVAFSWSARYPGTGAVFPALSPNGLWIAYAASGGAGDPVRIWVRPLGDQVARPLDGTDAPTYIAWSSDGRSLVFSSGDRLGRAGLDGGVQWLGTVAGLWGITPLSGGDVLAVTNPGVGSQMFRVPAEGGDPVAVALPKATGPAGAPTAPVMLPDGQHFLYLGWSGSPGERALFVGSFDGTPSTRIVASEGWGAYADGHLFFVRSQTLFAQPFDASALRLSGEPIRIVDDLVMLSLSGRVAYSVSDTGVLAYRQGGALGIEADLAWLDRTGRALGTSGDGGSIRQVRLSPDGRRVALNGGGEFRLSVLDLGNGVSSRLSEQARSVADPAWSPDSQAVAYGAIQNGVWQLYTLEVGSSTPTPAFVSERNPKWLDDWSWDGTWLLFHSPNPTELYAVKPGDPSSLTLLLETTQEIDGAHFSPDGNWVAYHVVEGGTANVWVASFPAFDRRRQVSRQGGGQAMWRGDGRELFYLTPDGRMMSVAITPQSSGGLDFAAPVELFQTPLATPILGIDQYSVTRDGQRFLVLRPRDTAAAVEQTINVIVNWKTGTTEGPNR